MGKSPPKRRYTFAELETKRDGGSLTVDEQIEIGAGLLRRRTKPEDFENHFSILNAFTCGRYWANHGQVLQMERLIYDYATTCRTASDVDTMLGILLVDSWPIGRSLKLVPRIYDDCRYVQRRVAIIREFSWVREGAKPQLVEAMRTRVVVAAESRHFSLRHAAERFLAHFPVELKGHYRPER